MILLKILDMVFILDGSLEHGAHVWIRYFDLLKALGYFDRVVKSVVYFGKDLFYFVCAQHVLSYHLI